jgi:hypothetical protein
LVALRWSQAHTALWCALLAGSYDLEPVLAILNLYRLDVRLILGRLDQSDELAEGPLASTGFAWGYELPHGQKADEEDDPNKERFVRLLHERDFLRSNTDDPGTKTSRVTQEYRGD